MTGAALLAALAAGSRFGGDPAGEPEDAGPATSAEVETAVFALG